MSRKSQIFASIFWSGKCTQIGAQMGSTCDLKCIKNSSKIWFIFWCIFGCIFHAKKALRWRQKASQEHSKITTGRESRVPRKRRWQRVGLRFGALKLSPKSIQKSIQKAINFHSDFWTVLGLIFGLILNPFCQKNDIRKEIKNQTIFLTDFETILNQKRCQRAAKRDSKIPAFLEHFGRLPPGPPQEAKWSQNGAKKELKSIQNEAKRESKWNKKPLFF